jgi:hypothetical protein
MATDSIMGNLFGVSPEIYEQNRQEQTRKQAIEFAKLDPYERTNALAFIGGRGLGNIVGGALGAQDPVMMMLSQRAELGQKYDLSKPEQWASMSKELLSKNDPEGAQIALQKGTDLELKQSQITKNLREGRASSMGADVMKANAEAGIKAAIRTLEGQEQTPEVVSQLQVYKDQLTALTRPKEYAPSELTKLMNERAQLDPVKDKEAYDILTARMKKLGSGKSIEESMGEGFGMLAKALSGALKKEGEETGKFSAENFNNLGKSVVAGTSSQRNLATLENALTNAFTGKFAESKEGVITSLTALGIPVGSDLKDAASNTQLIQAMGTRYVFPLVKNFPGSLAAKELDRLEKTAPNALQQPETIQRLVNLMKVDLAENKYTYDRAKEHKEKNKTLVNFAEADSRIEFQTKLNRLQDLVAGVKRKKSKTREEDQQINSLKTELGL